MLALSCASVGVAVAWYPVAARVGWANLSQNASLTPAFQIVGIILCLGSLMVVRRRKRPALVPEQLNEDEVRSVTDWMQDFEKHEAAKRPQSRIEMHEAEKNPQPKSGGAENPPEPERGFILKTGVSHEIRELQTAR